MHKATVELWLSGLVLIVYLNSIEYVIGDARNKHIPLYTNDIALVSRHFSIVG